MSFVCECPASALRFFTLASRTAPSRSPQPIYEHTLVSVTSDNTLEFVSVNPEMFETRCCVRVDARGHGGVAVPSDLMNNIIAALPPDENIVMSSDGKVLNIKWKEGEGRIGGITEDKFPPLLNANLEDGKEILVKAERFAIAARRVAAASGKPGKVQDVYTGVSLRHFSFLELAATDTYRLAVDRLDSRSAEGNGVSIVLPSKIIVDWGKISEEIAPDDVRIIAGSKFATLVVSTETVKVFSTSAFLSGKFPDYSVLIPSKENCIARVSVSTDILVNACRLILATVTDKTVAIELQCNRSGMLSINAVGATSKFSINLPAEVMGDMEAVFDARLFTEGVELLRVRTAVIELTSPRHPCVIRGDGEEFQYILMPMVQQ